MLISPILLSLLFNYSTTFQAIVFVSQMDQQIAAKQAILKDPQNYRVAARSLARLCQSDPTFFSDGSVFQPAWTPPEVLKLQPTWVQLTPESARIEFGGGFQHFGYSLTLDKNAPDQTHNNWLLTFYNEGSPDISLMNFHVNKQDHLDHDAIIRQTLSEFQHRIAFATPPLDSDVIERCRFLLLLNEPDLARTTTRDFARPFPNDWLDQILAFVLYAKTDPTASQKLHDWAQKKNDFTAWLYAAYAFDAVGDLKRTENAVQQAVAKGVDEPEWATTNARHRGHAMCAKLYEEDRYTTCIALCDALLAFPDDRDYLAPEIGAIRDAAARASNANGAKATLAPLTYPFEPFKDIDLFSLGASAVEVPLQTATLNRALNSIQNWTVQLGDWNQDNGPIMGQGDSRLEFNDNLPPNFKLSFSMDVVAGMRPRIFLEGTDIYFGNEGPEETLYVYGPGARYVPSPTIPYSNGQRLQMTMTITDGSYRLNVNGNEIFGNCNRSKNIRLQLRAGDGWSRGTTEFWDFKIEPVTATPQNAADGNH